ncbi:hypothetical protein [Genomoviridae sp.]|nr:hypothetical protein [Genomoviridae sp.]
MPRKRANNSVNQKLLADIARHQLVERAQYMTTRNWAKAEHGNLLKKVTHAIKLGQNYFSDPKTLYRSKHYQEVIKRMTAKALQDKVEYDRANPNPPDHNPNPGGGNPNPQNDPNLMEVTVEDEDSPNPFLTAEGNFFMPPALRRKLAP